MRWLAAFGMAALAACSSSTNGGFPPAPRDATIRSDASVGIVGPHDRLPVPPDVAASDASERDAPRVVRPPVTMGGPDRRLIVQPGVTMVVTPDKIRYGWGDRLGYALGILDPAPVRRVMRVPWDDLRYEYSFTINARSAPYPSYRACRRERGGRRAVQCWGANAYGGLGREDIVREEFLPVPGDPPVIAGADVLTTGNNGGCAGREDGIWCWPRVRFGEPLEAMVPADALPERRWSGRICAFITPVVNGLGQGDQCAYDCDQEQIVCRGEVRDAFGDLDPVAIRGTFVPVATVRSVASISANAGSGLFAALQDGTLLCRGLCGGSAGAPGLPHYDFQPIRGLPPVAFAAGTGLGTEENPAGKLCVLLRDGTVRCGGLCNPWIGFECPGLRGMAPLREVANLRNVIELSVSEGHACALTNSNEVWCWGDNRDHAVQPDGPATTIWEPVRVDLPARF